MSDDWNTVTVIGNRRGGGTGGGNKDRQVDIFLFSVGFVKWVNTLRKLLVLRKIHGTSLGL